jgi:hypothetical protein
MQPTVQANGGFLRWKWCSMTRLTGIPAQFIKVATASRPDLSQIVVGGIYLAPGSSNGVVRQWKVNVPAMTLAGEILMPGNAAQKDDSVDYEIDSSGALIITWSQAGPDNSGASSQPEIIIIPGVFPSAPSGGGGGGGSTTNVDQVARNAAAAAQSTADQALSTANSAKTTATNALNSAQSAHSRINNIPIWSGADWDWQQAINAQYAELTNTQSGSYNELIRIINEQIDKRSSSGDDDDPEKR